MKCRAFVSAGTFDVEILPDDVTLFLLLLPLLLANIAAAANPLLRDVGTVIVETGMRRGEVFTAQKDNVHLLQRYLFVPSGKTKFARRNVPLTESSFQVLKRRLEWAEGPYLFPHRRDPNKPLTTLKTAHEAAIKAAEITPHFRIYDLRRELFCRFERTPVGTANNVAARVMRVDAVRRPTLFVDRRSLLCVPASLSLEESSTD
jgi:integrase